MHRSLSTVGSVLCRHIRTAAGGIRTVRESFTLTGSSPGPGIKYPSHKRVVIVLNLLAVLSISCCQRTEENMRFSCRPGKPRALPEPLYSVTGICTDVKQQPALFTICSHISVISSACPDIPADPACIKMQPAAISDRRAGGGKFSSAVCRPPY